MFFIEMFFMGIFATYLMDTLSNMLATTKWIKPVIGPEHVGRWFLYMLNGKFIHNNIYKTPALKNEKFYAFVSHYIIGILLSGVYLFLTYIIPQMHYHLWVSLVFGILTVVFPWLWMFPAIGLGFMGLKSNNRLDVIRTSLVNHINFGLGLCIWLVLTQRLLI